MRMSLRWYLKELKVFKEKQVSIVVKYYYLFLIIMIFSSLRFKLRESSVYLK